jgi:hypothetical protein
LRADQLIVDHRKGEITAATLEQREISTYSNETQICDTDRNRVRRAAFEAYGGEIRWLELDCERGHFWRLVVTQENDGRNFLLSCHNPPEN